MEGMKRIWSRIFGIFLCVAGIFLAAPMPVLADTISYTSTYPDDCEDANMSNLVLFVGFSDGAGGTSHVNQHSTDATSFANGKCALDPACTFGYFNGSASNKQAMQRYLYNISYGQLRVDNLFPQYDAGANRIVPLILDGTADAYGSMFNDGLLLSAVLNKIADESIVPNNLNLDRNGDGTVDNLTLVILTDSGDNNTYYNVSYKGNAGGGRINGKSVWNYNILPEANIYFSLQNAGTIAHEFLHSCGYPDLYRNVGHPVGRWCIMSATDYRMLYPLAYLRSAVSGWFSMSTVTQDTQGITLYAASKTDASTKDRQAIVLKTPYSDNEFFVVEYRYKSSDTSEYDSSLHGTGLIVYRVNTAFNNNKLGPPDMVYVFRPGDYYVQNGGEYGDYEGMLRSFLSAESGRTSYGSSDLTKTLTDNAITYSDGQNSGIVIENVGQAGDTITFDVSFNENIANADYWNSEVSKEGDAIQIYSAVDETNGYIYVLEDSSKYLFCNNGTSYAQVSSEKLSAESIYVADLTVCNGSVYAAYSNSIGTFLSRFNGTGWDTVYSVSDVAAEVALAKGTDGVYMAYSTGAYTFYTIKYDGTNVISLPSITESGSLYGSLNLAVDGTTPYVAYRNANGNVLHVKKYVNSTWTSILQSGICGGDMELTIYNHIPVLATVKSYGNGDNAVYIYRAESEEWEQVGESFSEESVGDISINLVNGVPYLSYSVNGSQIKGAYLCGSSWKKLGNTINESNNSLKSYAYGDKITVVYLATSGVSTIKMYSTTTKTDGTNILSGIAGDPNPPVVQDDYTVMLDMPEGYTDAHIFVDGISYQATVNGSRASVTLADGNAKSAIMYKFKSNGAQNGMTVWKLEYVDHAYRATELDGFTDLLGYHGFSIRVTGEKGIRYKSSISQEDKERLKTTGIDGYRLVELGTVCCDNKYYNQYGLAIGSYKSSKGRTFWYEDGASEPEDKVIQVRDGRDRFANVVLTPKVSMYNVAFCFRGYAIVSDGTDTLILYSAPISRSVYTVAKQVIAAGEFQAGTAAYNFVNGIVETVEGR